MNLQRLWKNIIEDIWQERDVDFLSHPTYIQAAALVIPSLRRLLYHVPLKTPNPIEWLNQNQAD